MIPAFTLACFLALLAWGWARRRREQHAEFERQLDLLRDSIAGQMAAVGESLFPTLEQVAEATSSSLSAFAVAWQKFDEMGD